MSATLALPLQDEQKKLRVTWYAAVVLLLLFLSFLPTLRSFPSRELQHPVAVHTITLVFQWFLFWLAYRGIVSSGMRFSELFGNSRSIREHFWSDCKDAFVILFLALAVAAFLMKLQPFPRTSTFHSKNALQ